MRSPSERDSAIRQRRFETLQLHLRLQSALLMSSVLVLALTGLPQKFDSLPLSREAMEIAGGIENLRLVHHLAAGVLVFAGAYHVALVLAAVLLFKASEPLRMIPGGADLREATRTFCYFVGLGRRAPAPRTRRYFRKADYWFLAWSLGAMAVSGLVDLFGLEVSRLLSGDVVATAQGLHSRAAPLVVAWVLAIHLLYVGWLRPVTSTPDAPPLQAAHDRSPPAVSPPPTSGLAPLDHSTAPVVRVSLPPASESGAGPEAST